MDLYKSPMPVEFRVTEFTQEEIVEMLAVLPPHSPLQPVLFAELQRRRGPVAPPAATLRKSPRLAMRNTPSTLDDSM